MSSLIVTAEVAASLRTGKRSLLMLPYSTAHDGLLSIPELDVLEPFVVNHGKILYAGDYPTSYGWSPAHHMRAENVRMRVSISRVRLFYKTALTDQQLLDDSVYRHGDGFAWQRLALNPVTWPSAAAAWVESQKAAWGQTGGTKVLVASISVTDVVPARVVA